MEYYRPRLSKWVRYRNIEDSELLEGNTNTYTAVKQDLSPVILASRIRFHPYSPHQRTICMRVEAYGCSYDGEQNLYQNLLLKKTSTKKKASCAMQNHLQIFWAIK